MSLLQLEHFGKGKHMKRQGKGDPAGIPLASPTGSSSVQPYHDYRKVASAACPGNGLVAAENASHTRSSRDGPGRMSSIPDILSHSQDHRGGVKDEGLHRNSGWMLDSSSLAYSGPEDNSTDPHEILTETSTLTFIDGHGAEESAENHSLHGVEMIYLKEFVLIDDDDDGDMSLREKTVTDISIMDGRAADLVCGRLLSTSSGSLSESAAPEAPPPPEQVQVQTVQDKKQCCSCTVL